MARMTGLSGAATNKQNSFNNNNNNNYNYKGNHTHKHTHTDKPTNTIQYNTIICEI